MNDFKLWPLLLLLLSACGKQTGVNPSEGIYPANYSNSFIPLTYDSQVSCGKYDFLLTHNFNLRFFQNGDFSTSEIDFSNLISGSFIRDNQVIARTVFGERSEMLLSGDQFRYLERKDYSDVRLCGSLLEYPEDSVENAALTSAHIIKKTADFFQNLFPEIRVSPITLNISPIRIQSVLMRSPEGNLYRQSSYMTDNAFYSPKDKAISFLPHSVVMRNYGFKSNLWEVPMVASHEYGHHLFQAILQRPEMKHQGCFELSLPKEKVSFKSMNPRKVSQGDVYDAYNEGFADLISFYTLGKVEGSVEGVRCLEVSRNVESPKFYNGRPKYFSETVIHSFFSNYEDMNSGSCDDQSYQDIHSLGAIFAHVTDRYLSHLSQDPTIKLDAVVKWLKYLKGQEQSLKSLSPERFLKESYAELLRGSTLRLQGEFTTESCELIESLFPKLYLTECSSK